MPEIDHSQLANPVWKTRQHLELSQARFATKLRGAFQSINRWENGRTQLLLIALEKIEHLLHQMDEADQDLLVKDFSE
jgi:DNA-binding transcriptional regulator YiaG